MMLLDAGYETKDGMTFQEHRAACLCRSARSSGWRRWPRLVEGFRRPEDWLDACAWRSGRRCGTGVAVKTIVATARACGCAGRTEGHQGRVRAAAWSATGGRPRSKPSWPATAVPRAGVRGR